MLDKAELIVARQAMRDRIHSLFRHRGGADRELMRLCGRSQPMRVGDTFQLTDKAVSHAAHTNEYVRRAVERFRQGRGTTLDELREAWAGRGKALAGDAEVWGG